MLSWRLAFFLNLVMHGYECGKYNINYYLKETFIWGNLRCSANGEKNIQGKKVHLEAENYFRTTFINECCTFTVFLIICIWNFLKYMFTARVKIKSNNHHTVSLSQRCFGIVIVRNADTTFECNYCGEWVTLNYFKNFQGGCEPCRFLVLVVNKKSLSLWHFLSCIKTCMCGWLTLTQTK